MGTSHETMNEAYGDGMGGKIFSNGVPNGSAEGVHGLQLHSYYIECVAVMKDHSRTLPKTHVYITGKFKHGRTHENLKVA